MAALFLFGQGLAELVQVIRELLTGVEQVAGLLEDRRPGRVLGIGIGVGELVKQDAGQAMASSAWPNARSFLTAMLGMSKTLLARFAGPMLRTPGRCVRHPRGGRAGTPKMGPGHVPGPLAQAFVCRQTIRKPPRQR